MSVAVPEKEGMDDLAIKGGNLTMGIVHRPIGCLIVYGAPDLAVGCRADIRAHGTVGVPGGRIAAGRHSLGPQCLTRPVWWHLVGHDTVEVLVHLHDHNRVIGHQDSYRGGHLLDTR